MAISSQVFMAIGWKSLREIFFFDVFKIEGEVTSFHAITYFDVNFFCVPVVSFRFLTLFPNF